MIYAWVDICKTLTRNQGGHLPNFCTQFLYAIFCTENKCSEISPLLSARSFHMKCDVKCDCSNWNWVMMNFTRELPSKPASTVPWRFLHLTRNFLRRTVSMDLPWPFNDLLLRVWHVIMFWNYSSSFSQIIPQEMWCKVWLLKLKLSNDEQKLW